MTWRGRVRIPTEIPPSNGLDEALRPGLSAKLAADACDGRNWKEKFPGGLCTAGFGRVATQNPKTLATQKYGHRHTVHTIDTIDIFVNSGIISAH